MMKGFGPGMTVAPLTTHYFDELQVGMEATIERVVAPGDVIQFAAVSGDHNPLHIDHDYAAKTIFGGCIAHGMLTASYISAVFAMQLPGPGAVYVSQSLNFRGPVRAGDTVVTRVAVADLYPAKRRAMFDCKCTVNGKTVLEGEAILMVPVRPA